MSDQARPVFNDRYEIQSRLGRGGMADVFKAHDRLLDRSVAIKVLFPEFANDENFVARFRREAQSAANLTHPNIVGVYDWGQESGTYFIVMEYVAGRSLADVIKGGGPISATRAADIAADVAGALGVAHRNNVVHRDVKPANILVSDTGQVKVADFGIARAMNAPSEQDLTQAGAVMGTATYFSPEQAQGFQPDPRSDLYSLGIVMYEMVTGKPPFSGDNPVSIAYKQVHEMPIRPAQLNPSVPSAFEQIIHRLLQKDPNKRYATTDELRVDLRRFREGQPLGVRPSDQVGAARALPFDPLAAGAGVATAAMRATPAASVPTASMGAGRQVYAEATRAVPAQSPTRQSPPPPTRPTYDDEPRRAWPIVLAVIGTVIVVAGVLFALFKFLSTSTSSDVQQVTVANVVNKTVSEAQQILKAQGLEVDITRVPSEDVEVDVVIDQTPAANAVADTGTRVKLTVSSGKDQIVLPNVIGAPQEAARATLAKAGFTDVVFVPEPSAAQPKGTVTGQDPPPGKAAPNAQITLKISAGPDQYVIENVIGLDQIEAVKRLSRAGLDVVTVQQADPTIPIGKVVATDPIVGTPVDIGSQVTVLVSSGPVPVIVPNVVGKSDADATDILQTAGLKRQLVTVPVTDPAQNGKVVSQSPVGNGTNTLAPGSTVILNIGKAPDPTTTTPTTTVPATTVAPTTTVA